MTKIDEMGGSPNSKPVLDGTELIPLADLGGSGDENTSAQSVANLTKIAITDGTVTVDPLLTLNVTPGTLTDDGSGQATLTSGGGSSITTLIRGQTLTLFMDPAGNDANDGLTAPNAIQTIARLVEILKEHRLEGFNGPGILPEPSIGVEMVSGSYTGGDLSINDLGNGLLTFNSTAQAVVFTTGIEVDAGDQLHIVMDNCEFQSSGINLKKYSLSQLPKQTSANPTFSAGNFSQINLSSINPANNLYALLSGNNAQTTVLVRSCSRFQLTNCTFADIVTADFYAPVIGLGTSLVQIQDCNLNNIGPLAFGGDNATISISNLTINGSGATRYLVALTDNSTAIYNGTLSAGIVLVRHFVRCLGNGTEVVVNDLDLYNTLTDSVIDILFSAQGATITTQYSHFQLEAIPRIISATIFQYEELLLGRDTLVTSGLATYFFRNNTTENIANSYVGSKFRITSVSGGQFRLEWGDAGGTFYVNNGTVTGAGSGVTSSAAAQTTVECFILSGTEVIITVLEGSVV